MPLTTDLNVPPYFDDYDEAKNYHRVLFRPEVAVQARELTQSQSILQNQIERFGNWAFKSGDVVDGCSITDIPVLPFVRLADAASNGTANSVNYDARDYVGLYATSSTSNLTAKVLLANVGFAANYPNTNVTYIKYINTGTSGETSFSNSEQLRFYSVAAAGNTYVANVYVLANTGSIVPTGDAHGVSVSEGIIYASGNFVKVQTPTIGVVNAYGTYASNNLVGFNLLEEIITENQDASLFDNALGYTNENAPGAHRLKLVPTLIAYSSSDSVANNFNPIATYNYGSLVQKSTSGGLYSSINTAIANRTYEESGNYVVNPFTVDTFTNINNALPLSSSNNVVGRISPGVGYAQGNRVELQKTAYVDMRRGIDTQTNKQQIISFNYGSYFTLNEVAGSFDFDRVQLVNFYDKPQTAVTNKTFSGTTPVGNLIGTASVRCFSYSSGNPGTNTATYLLHVFNITMNTGYNTSQIKSVYYNGTNKGIADVTSAGLVNSQSKKQLYSFGVSGLKNLRDAADVVNTEYVFRTKKAGTLVSSGNIVITPISTSLTGGVDVLPYGGTAGQLSDAEASKFTVVITANVDSAALSGTVDAYAGNNFVNGHSTTFTTNFAVGDQIKINTTVKTITSIVNATAMTVDSPFGNFVTNAYSKSYIAGKILPIAYNVNGPKSYIFVSNTTSFTIVTGQVPSTNIPVDVYYNVNRTTTVPATKDVKKNRFVKIDTTTNPKGPWCIGFGDIHKVTKIYASSSGYATSGANVIDATTLFTYGTGQKDTHYDYGYLYPKASFDSVAYPYILVQVDYFVANTAAGVGFFTVESYPIDDANTANTVAIQTKDIPLYVDESGNKIALRDCIDFRVPAISTANDTGPCDTSNSTQVTTALSYATVNPSSTLVFANSTNLNNPSYGQNFQADYTMYLSRKDLIIITADNKLKVKEGVSSTVPQTPLYPDNAMALAVLNIPPYPSLSTDQVDEFLQINQNAKNLIRDTSTAISGSTVTNRRYTMKDIGKLDQRITNIEYYTSLSLLEKNATDLTVTDANGLDRFKNGIFVDPFSNYALSDVSNQEYSIAIDQSKGVARPHIIREIIDIKFNTGTNVQQTGRVVTLAYTEVPFLVQPYATKYRSSALVAYAWNGSCILIPPYDNHGDTINTGSINITVDNTKPWKDFAAGPYGSIWGDWRTTTAVTSNSVITGTVQNVQLNLGLIGTFETGGVNSAASQAGQQAIALAAAQAGVSPDVIRGHLSLTYNGSGQVFNF